MKINTDVTLDSADLRIALWKEAVHLSELEAYQVKQLASFSTS
jgi:hypothetical protein